MNEFDLFAEEIHDATGCIAEAVDHANEDSRTREFVRDLIGFVRIKFALFEQKIGYPGGRSKEESLETVRQLLDWTYCNFDGDVAEVAIKFQKAMHEEVAFLAVLLSEK